MPQLSISDFSSLREANFSLSPVNVIIGPQGSGKSVTTKLLYFFADILVNYTQYAERGDDISDYKKILAKQFCVWFPPQAWGPGKFNLNYTAGLFSVRILRRKSQGKLIDDVSITFSEWFNEFYNSTSDLLNQNKASDYADIRTTAQFSESIDRLWKVKELIARRLDKELQNEYISNQTFIPAGRAFFTSIGRLVAGFEQSGSLDPVTIKFARLFANIRDRSSQRSAYRMRRLGDEFNSKRTSIMNKLFGGEIKFEGDQEYLETEDGRKIPFSALSSGQQELLPMWSLMDYYNELDAIRIGATGPFRRNRELIYIEEPEAHLFPSAQSSLMEFLIGSIVSERKRRNLIITTHSPYIMGKLNVFLKAGQLARRKKRNQEINEVVSRDCWLNDQQLSAFAIENGQLRNLLDDDGLIDGRYLDEISETIALQFSDLLQIESEI